ncbi:MAG: hypothetical protein Q9209_002892 [Squamulea sp. 1 TL-2023]
MTGAQKKRNKDSRQAAVGSGKMQDYYNTQRNPGRYDGPSDRPGSSSGQPRPGSSRGMPGASVRSSSRPRSDVHQPGPSANVPGAPLQSSSRPGSAGGPPLRDPARDPPVALQQKLPSRVDWGGNLYSYYSNEPVPSQLMKRPGFGRDGKAIKLRLNSHAIIGQNTARYYQYAVQVGKPDSKRALIKAVWNSRELASKIPGGIKEWIYDGNALAWSKQNLSNDFSAMVDLDKEKGRDPSTIPDEKRDVHRVWIRRSAIVDLNNIYAYLNGQVSFGPGVIDAINFLDHVIREWPSKQHINIKKSYFDRSAPGQKDTVGGGVEAMRGIYQSIRMAEGKRMVVNVDVSHTCFWNKANFPMIVNQLSGHMNLDTLPQNWRDTRGKTNNKFLTMKRLKKNDFFVTHRNRSAQENDKVWKVHDILEKSAREYTFTPYLKEQKKDGPPINLFDYYQQKNPLINGPQSDPAKCAELLFYGVGNKHNARPQLLIFILPNTSSENYLRIKKSCDCRYGSFTQCVQGAQVIKNNPQYHSNVLMKVNAKLGGTTARVAMPSPSGHFGRPTMIIGADVSHAAPGIGAPSYAAMTVSMDKYAARYAAGVQTNGFRVEMISTRNLRDMLTPLFRHWTANVSGGRLPDHVYYFRDGVSEGQFLNVIKYEVADIKEIWNEMVTPKAGEKPHEVKFTVVVAEKRHHIRFFPGKAGDENQNPLPGTIVDRDVTHPFENDIYLCSHKALKGTARPTHYHMLLDEANVPVDAFQKMLYEHSYQYMRSTTPVSLFPAVYYAHLASNRARAHEDIAEPDRRVRDAGDPSNSNSGRPAEEAAPLLPMIPRDGLPWGMWYI